jgi:RHS repeat-associated protein
MPGRYSTLLYGMLFLLAASAIVGERTGSPASETLQSEALWIADAAGIYKIATVDGRLLLSAPEAGGARTVAVDPSRATTWAWNGHSLLALGFDGSRRLSISLDLPATTHTDLVVHSEDGSVWIAAGHELRNVSPTGQLLVSRRLSANVVTLTVDRTLLWTATATSVAAHDALTGDPVRILDLGGKPDVRGISVTPSRKVWVALRNEARLLDVDGALLLSLPGTNLTAIAAAPDGGAWVAESRTLRRVSASGSVLLHLEPFGARGQITALAAHPVDGSVWVSGGSSLVRIDASGQVTLRSASPTPAGPIRDLALFADAVPPQVEILAPAAGAVLPTRSPSVEIAWRDAGTGIAPDSLVLRLDGALPAVSCERREEGASCIPAPPLAEGAHTLTATVRDRAGNLSSPAEIRFSIDTTPPAITLTSPAAGAIVEEPELSFEGTVSEPADLRLDGATLPIAADGSFVHGPVLLPEGATSFSFMATDRAGNTGSLTVTVTYEPPAGPGLPPDPATVAPPLDSTVTSDLFAAVDFLWTGRRPAQTGVAPGAIERQRIAVLRGRVLTRDGEPLAGARITMQGHPELGATLSREDGAFDMVVNGGGFLTVAIEKEGLLPAWRQIQVPWRDWVFLEDVALVPLDAASTLVTAGAEVLQVARGSQVEDADGTRRATLLFPAGTGAHLVLPDGTAQPLATLTVRATEYTVGPRGPQAMPAPLPPASAYTYAVELSVDEAIAAGAEKVVFDRPVASYVENFLDFPVGGRVPAGYYDRRQGAWIPSDDGRVVRVLESSAEGGEVLAQLDVDGSGVPASASALAALGITDDERRALAELYTPGQSLWRVLVSHFTPWDYNWPYRPVGPPEDATSPDPDRAPQKEDPEEEPCEQAGSIIECQNQTLGEELPVTGTPFALAYRSDRVPGRKTSHLLRVPLSGAGVPASLQRIVLKITVAGRLFTTSHPALPDQDYEFAWDGRDAYGRILQGVHPVHVELGYVYDGIYGEPTLASQRSFGQPGSSVAGGPPTREEVTLWQSFRTELGRWSAHPLGFGGWSLSPHHVYDPRGIVHLGDGGRVLGAGELDQVITTLAGSATTNGTTGDGGPASQALLDDPESVLVDPAGNIYVGERTRIRRIDRATGRISTIAGDPAQWGFRGDRGPATQALLNGPRGLAMDSSGNLYFADAYNHRIRRIDTAGMITTVAGTGISGYNGDGIAATTARLSFPWDVALDFQGNLYIADSDNHRVRKVTPSGTIVTVGSTNPPWIDVNTPAGVAVGPNGGIYVSSFNHHVVWRIEPDGDRKLVAGNGAVDYNGFFRDGVPADKTIVSYPGDLAFDIWGNLYVTSQGRVRKVGPTGFITTVSGAGRDLGDGYASAAFPGVQGLALDGRGILHVADPHRIRRISPTLPDLTGSETPIAAPDGSEIWIFDSYGRHLRTLDGLTGALRLRFGYDPGGRLASIEDGDGLVTHIERDGAGRASAIVAPFGQRTRLTYHPSGSLATLVHPGGATLRFSMTDDGLLTGMTDPRGGTSRLAYDTAGRLVRDEDAAGGFKALARVPLDDSYRIDLSTAEGRTHSYSVETLPTEERRWSNTSPSGLTSETLFRKDGSRRMTFPDGTVTTETAGPDPRFGLQAPTTKSLQVRTPAGRTWSLTNERTATFSSSENRLFPTLLRETVRINGRAYTSLWDATQRRHTLTTPEGRRRLLDLDAKGRPVTLQVGDLAPVTFGYDAAGRLAEIAQGSGAERRVLGMGYDTEGWLASLTDPLARSVGFERDDTGRVSRQTLPGARAIDFSYDPNGNLAGLTPPDRPVHAFGYTAVDLQEQYQPPDLGTEAVDTTYLYDLDRKLTGVLRPDGKTVTLTHDGAGRLAALDFSRGRTSYTYDPATGQLAGISAPGGQSLTYTYDGSLLTGTTWTGPVSGSVARTYDNNFRVVSETVNGGAPITYQYDADGLLVRAGEMTLTRDPQTGLVRTTVLGVVTTENAYNAFGELARLEAKVRGLPVFTAVYTRDLLGRITRKEETIEGVTDVWDYTYDPAGRLQEVHRNSARLSRYEYDANGNRLKHITPTQTVTATYDAQDRLLTYGDIAYTYTANGDLATKTQNGQTVHYEYDELGNLVKVTLADGIAIEYVIDGQNRRVGKKVNGVLVQGWLYGDGTRAAAAATGVFSQFIYSSSQGVPAYIREEGETYRILSDHLGSPRIVVNVTLGTITGKAEFDAFGQVISASPEAIRGFSLAGGLYDSRTRLIRFGARDYDPQTGRWTSKDPILLSGDDTNFFAYSASDPVNLIDPLGLSAYNSCRCVIYAKPDSEGTAERIEPGRLYPGKIDGITHPKRPGEVYKVPANADVVAFEDGSMMVLPNDDILSPLGSPFADWKGEDFLQGLHDSKNKDHGWDAIFNASRLGPQQQPPSDLNRCPYQ